MKEEAKKIQAISQEVILKMGIQGKAEFEVDEEANLVSINFSLNSQDSKLFLKQRAEGLTSLQFLIRAVSKKFFKEGGIRINLDINNYKRKKAEFLKSLAKELAQEVALTKRAKELPPMPASERRIIHITLADHPNVFTESTGEKTERRVIIKPKEFIKGEHLEPG